MQDIVDLIYDSLQREIRSIREDVNRLTTTTEQAQYVDGIPCYTFASLPATGLGNGSTYLTIAFCSNGRKSGEGVGAGTGVLVYWNNPSSQWLKFNDDTAVTI